MSSNRPLHGPDSLLARLTPRRELRYQGKYTEAFLDGFRRETDPVADEAYAALACAGRRGPDMLADVRARAAEEGGPYARFLEEVATVPDWVSFDRMRHGSRLITRYGPFYGLSLLTGSLVGGAIFIKQALVTASTGRLSNKSTSTRRIEETGAMINALAFDGALRPGGAAHEAVVRVRILHSAIRAWLRATGRLDPTWDEPICQEDLAITLSLFSYLNVRSLLRMGIRLSDEEIDSHHHLWRYVGHLIGIREPLLTQDIYEEQRLWDAFLLHAAHPELLSGSVKNVLDSVAELTPIAPHVKPFLYSMTRELAGHAWVVGMELPNDQRYPGPMLVRGLGYVVSSAVRRSRFVADALHARAIHRILEQRRALVSSQGMDYDVRTPHADDAELRKGLRAVSERLRPVAV